MPLMFTGLRDGKHLLDIDSENFEDDEPVYRLHRDMVQDRIGMAYDNSEMRTQTTNAHHEVSLRSLSKPLEERSAIYKNLPYHLKTDVRSSRLQDLFSSVSESTNSSNSTAERALATLHLARAFNNLPKTLQTEKLNAELDQSFDGTAKKLESDPSLQSQFSAITHLAETRSLLPSNSQTDKRQELLAKKPFRIPG
jgi:hypothetical protein